MSTKQTLAQAIVFSLLLTAPLSVYAANNGTEHDNVPENSDKLYANQYETTGDVSGAALLIDTAISASTYTHLAGGYTASGNATGNTTKITADVDVGTIYGGYSKASGNASYNEITISSGKIGSDTRVSGGFAEDGDANYNKVTINTNTDTKGIEIIGGYTKSGASIGNTVDINMTGKMENAYIYGAQSSGNGDLTGNTVIIRGSGEITGANIAGGYAENGKADGNTVHISSGQLTSVEVIVGGLSNNSSATGNTVIISGGSITGDGRTSPLIVGGGTDTDNQDLTYNTVTIEGTAELDNSVIIYGAYADRNTPGDIRTGNTLNIYRSGVSIKSVDNFQHYDLAIDPNKTTLTVADSLTLQSGDTITSTKVLGDINVGDNISLLASNGTLDISNATLVNGKAQQGILYLYGYELVEENGKLVAKITSKEGNKQTASVADGRLAALGMLTGGADLVASTAMSNAASGNNQYDVFGAMSYGQHSMDSVSSIDIQGTSMLVGMSRNLQHTNGYTTIGAFLESGWGTYDSEMAGAKAKGHTNYYGLGLLARANRDSGIYTEGSLRIGRIGNTYSGDKADDGMYDVTSTYYGAHLGIGKITKINERSNWDLYAKYFWTHQTGTDADIMGDRFDFGSTDSHRARIGARYNNTNKNVTRYIGLAYEHEFSAKATATALGIDVASPSVKGSSGILELGLVYKPSTDSRFSMDFGMNAYAGKRQGFSGNMKLNWSF